MYLDLAKSWCRQGQGYMQGFECETLGFLSREGTNLLDSGQMELLTGASGRTQHYIILLLLVALMFAWDR